MKVTEILEQAESAADDHFKCARFVKEAEMPESDNLALLDDEQRSEYQARWFELEIVNALALDEWESDGKPAVWTDAWSERYKRDAKELVGKLCALLQPPA